MWQKIKNQYHLFMAVLANAAYLFPTRKIKVIGVTGTDGKTTTVSLIYHILSANNFRVSMVTSIGAVINNKNFDIGFHVTTPSSFSLQKLIKMTSIKETDYFILEVTSHAIDQNRIYGIPFEIGVLTNVTNEHLDYHKTYKNYLYTKLKLIFKAKIGIVNFDDDSYSYISKLKETNKNHKLLTFGLSDKADINPNNFNLGAVNFKDKFNQYNLLAAVAAVRQLGVTNNQIINALKVFKMPIGRMQTIYDKDFKVVIDFAHTPNAFYQILSYFRPIIKGKIIHVFGSAGERDAKKRPILGKTSSEYSDVLILTAEDPRSENVDKIINEISVGIKNEKVNILKIPNRKKAIEEAVKMAKKNDLIIITGKAHEKSMNMGNGEEAWDEFSVVEKALKIHEKN